MTALFNHLALDPLLEPKLQNFVCQNQVLLDSLELVRAKPLDSARLWCLFWLSTHSYVTYLHLKRKQKPILYKASM